MDTEKDKKLNLDVLREIVSYLNHPDASRTTVDCVAHYPVDCHVCGRHLKNDVPYTALLKPGYNSKHLMKRSTNWCRDCDKIVRDPATSKDFMRAEMRKAIDEFIDRVKLKGGRDG